MPVSAQSLRRVSALFVAVLLLSNSCFAPSAAAQSKHPPGKTVVGVRPVDAGPNVSGGYALRSARSPGSLYEFIEMVPAPDPDESYYNPAIAVLMSGDMIVEHRLSTARRWTNF